MTIVGGLPTMPVECTIADRIGPRVVATHRGQFVLRGGQINLARVTTHDDYDA